MHFVLRLVVEADDVDDAVETAVDRFEHFLQRHQGESTEGQNGPFDYCWPMEEGHGVSGADRWFDYADEPLAYPINGERGQEELETAWEETWESLQEDLEQIEEVFTSAEEVAEVANDETIREVMHGLDAQAINSSYCLYDAVTYENDVQPISTPERYEKFCHRLKDSYWIVPLDVSQ